MYIINTRCKPYFILSINDLYSTILKVTRLGAYRNDGVRSENTLIRGVTGQSFIYLILFIQFRPAPLQHYLLHKICIYNEIYMTLSLQFTVSRF
jgi:hypothetical protein